MPGSSRKPLPAADLEHVLKHTDGIWDDLRGARLFVTGGTGFVGSWMLETLLRANDELGLRTDCIVLTRAPGRFEAIAPHIARHPSVTLHEGDVQSFDLELPNCSHVLHLATESGAELTPAASYQTAEEGTKRILELSRLSGVRKLLFTSSGAVYGAQPPDIERLPEEYPSGLRPDEPRTGYAQGKRAAEELLTAAARELPIAVKIARCFAFVGPLLPLDANFAIGNFIRDAIYDDHIQVNGDGSPRRSYLYASDLAAWLWTILVRGESGRPYNVGSDLDLSIADLAHVVASEIRPGIPIRIAEPASIGTPPARYVPSTARAATELDLLALVTLPDGIRRTAEWHVP